LVQQRESTLSMGGGGTRGLVPPSTGLAAVDITISPTKIEYEMKKSTGLLSARWNIHPFHFCAVIWRAFLCRIEVEEIRVVAFRDVDAFQFPREHSSSHLFVPFRSKRSAAQLEIEPPSTPNSPPPLLVDSQCCCSICTFFLK
jgi:hypothetical protein